MNHEIEKMATPEKFESLGKEIKISPKSVISINAPGYHVRYFCPTVEIVIGIGKNETATLIMSDEALKALREGEQISITTAKKFRNAIK